MYSGWAFYFRLTFCPLPINLLFSAWIERGCLFMCISSLGGCLCFSSHFTAVSDCIRADRLPTTEPTCGQMKQIQTLLREIYSSPHNTGNAWKPDFRGEQMQKSGSGGFFQCALSLRILDFNCFQLLRLFNSRVQISRPTLGLCVYSVVLVRMGNQFEGLIVSE